MQFAMLMGFAIAFGLAAVGYRLAVMYYGPSYKECGEALALLSVTVIPIAWANVLRTQYLIPSAKDKEYVLSVVVGAVLNFIINFTLIPHFGLKGAIAGTITAEYSVAILQTIQVRHEVNVKDFFKKSVPFLVIGIIMFVGTSLLGRVTNESLLGLLLQVSVGFILYIGLSVIYCVRTKNAIYDYVNGFIQRKIKRTKTL